MKKLLSDSVIYGLSSIVGRFLNYLLFPVYTYHISAASGGYGVVTEVYAYTALLLVILTLLLRLLMILSLLVCLLRLLIEVSLLLVPPRSRVSS